MFLVRILGARSTGNGGSGVTAAVERARGFYSVVVFGGLLLPAQPKPVRVRARPKPVRVRARVYVECRTLTGFSAR